LFPGKAARLAEYEGKQGLVVLTNERLFFFEKSLGSETVEEFPLKSIPSLSVSKGITGETLKIFASAQLERLATLREKGVLSEQEFEEKKRQLLDRF
jgi:hypothetical protein